MDDFLIHSQTCNKIQTTPQGLIITNSLNLIKLLNTLQNKVFKTITKNFLLYAFLILVIKILCNRFSTIVLPLFDMREEIRNSICSRSSPTHSQCVYPRYCTADIGDFIEMHSDPRCSNQM